MIAFLKSLFTALPEQGTTAKVVRVRDRSLYAEFAKEHAHDAARKRAKVISEAAKNLLESRLQAERREREIVTREALIATITETCAEIRELVEMLRARESSK